MVIPMVGNFFSPSFPFVRLVFSMERKKVRLDLISSSEL